MNSDPIPIAEVRGQLLISVQRELSDVDAVRLQQDILDRLRATGASGVVLDLSGVEVVDSYIARVFNDIGTAATTMGALAVLVGLRPAVALTLVEMDVELTSLRSELTLDRALETLDRSRAAAERARRPGGEGNRLVPTRR